MLFNVDGRSGGSEAVRSAEGAWAAGSLGWRQGRPLARRDALLDLADTGLGEAGGFGELALGQAELFANLGELGSTD